MTESHRPTIRLVDVDDDLSRLTALIHSAYAPHARLGLRYWGTHQSVEDTAKRFASGTGLVMVNGAGDYVGTLTLRPPQPDSAVALYRDPVVWSLCQFCISPQAKGRGYGTQLHAYATDFARRAGARMMALDTAQPAKALIAMYESWGYQVVGECDWRPLTNYTSVLMSRSLTGSAGANSAS
ncbi:ribosomal protein S18 acetylase RimI-like enzyme [Acidovorax sp. 69]|uniref:GNAT family N-acetyltransferase n=1 Tax=Acidovorax sp. 69 TaxID=2035202 RepID=UPI000C245133|nr:GNAT family N-acetyltransferase [Acidovorax sp. 69]PJI97705.1 ribosomal protein S18 acetylase RimI-like enzyme [Acidovorax sp. 69]